MVQFAAGNDSVTARKARGAFFTPPDLAAFIARWAIRASTDRILEPSCGEAAFLTAAAIRLRALGSHLDNAKQLTGLDIHDRSVAEARSLLRQGNAKHHIRHGDFFDLLPNGERFDAVLGNPPYVRYQNFSGHARTRALEAALRQGVRLTGLASSWAGFTVHAASFLGPAGRLGLVLPAELLSVNYAAEIRRFLLNRFGTVRLVLFDERVFPEVLEDVVLLLAEGVGGASKFEVYQARNAADLGRVDAKGWTRYEPSGSEKWTAALLPEKALRNYHSATRSDGFEVLLDWGETYLGAVTGNNKYFSLSREAADAAKLSPGDLVPISPPGSRHFRGLNFSAAAWRELTRTGHACYLFYPNIASLSSAAKRYIAKGEAASFHKTYKCRMRSPWWRVPLVEKPDIIFTYMNHERPRLTTNGAGVHLLNSLYGIKLALPRKAIGQSLLPLAFLNSLTLLGAEVVGRSYGGGMLKHEPKEADTLPVPSFELLRGVAHRLRLLRSRLEALLRSDDAASVLDIVDRVILRDELGMSQQRIDTLRAARTLLLQRRVARARS